MMIERITEASVMQRTILTVGRRRASSSLNVKIAANTSTRRQLSSAEAATLERTISKVSCQ